MKVLLVLAEHRTAPFAAEFRGHGWEVRAAGDIVTGLTVARHEAPDAIVVGDRLPGGSSEMLVTRLRGLVATALTPIVALSREPEAQPEARAVAADVWLECDIDPATLRTAVERAVRGEPPAVAMVPAGLLDQPERLTTLRETGLEPGQPDRWFDTIAVVAADLLPADVCLVTLVSQAEQFFPGRSVRPHEAGGRRTPLSHSFCQWTVASGEPLVVEDATQHPVLQHNPAVEALQHRAYAGVPVVAGDATLGTVCAVDAQPRRWSEEDVRLLRRLAVVAEAELTLRLHGLRTATDAAAGETAIAAAKRGFVQITRLLADHHPAPDRAGFDGLVALLGWFTDRLPSQAADEVPSA